MRSAPAAWICSELGPETPWHISRFFPAHEMLGVPPTPIETLLVTAQIGRSAGLRHVYVGNAPQLGLAHTTCAECGALLIERSGYRIRSRLTEDGMCGRCGRRLAGIALGHEAPVSGNQDVHQ